ncbi:hypothetical protein ES703_48565 [subsurface metagenome]
MNRIRSSPPWSLLIFAFFVFIAVLAMAFIYQDTLKETVLVFILYLIWVGDLAILSFDQRCIWQMALVIALILTIAFSRRKTEKSISSPPGNVHRRSSFPDRIRFWRTQVRIGSSAGFARRSRPSELSGLVIKALAYRENTDFKEIKEQLRSHEIQAPQEVRYILGIDDLQRATEQQPGNLVRIRKKFNLMRGKVLDPAYSPDPRFDKVAAYLESLLEAEHDI